MNRLDINCMTGQWPFRKLGHHTLEEVTKTHLQNGITGGFMSSMESVFYNDPYEGDEDLSKIIHGTSYFHIQSINPLLSFTVDDIRRGVEHFGIKGVKCYPCYHAFALDGPELEPVCRYLQEAGIPLMVQLRMEDYRADYIAIQKQLGAKEIGSLLEKYPDNKIVLLTPRLNEIKALTNVIKDHDNVLLDTSGLKDGLFSVEDTVAAIGPDKLAYGSLYPLFCMKSTLMLVEEAVLSSSIKQKILSGNAKDFFG